MTGKQENNEYCRLNIEYLRFAFGGINLKKIEQSDTTNPPSLRGVGHYDPSGPEAKIPNPKLLLRAE